MAQSADEFLRLLPRFRPEEPDAPQAIYDYDVSQFAVTTAQLQMLPTDPRRVGYVLVNVGSGRAWIAFKPGVLTTSGFPVFELGGVFHADVWPDRSLPTRPVFVIGTAATTVAILRKTRVG